LFNILAHGETPLEGARVLDGFAGSGALGLEALSRGAIHAVFIENDRTALGVLADNIARLGVTPLTTVCPLDATRLPPAGAPPCDLVFLDPPYRRGLAPTALLGLTTRGWLSPQALAVVEVAADEPFESPAPMWQITDERRYGAARLVFLRRGPP
jgi:16S rRNA (guanine966-N2)-methyltransferase